MALRLGVADKDVNPTGRRNTSSHALAGFSGWTVGQVVAAFKINIEHIVSPCLKQFAGCERQCLWCLLL